MQLTYYGHSCFAVLANGKTILLDPFITHNELAKDVSITDINADYILLSHGHVDHIADCVAIAEMTGAKVVCSWEIYEWLNRQGIKNTHPMNTGGRWDFGDFSVKCTVAQHSSGLPDGSYGGSPMGFIIYSNEGLKNSLGYVLDDIVGDKWWQIRTSSSEELERLRDEVVHNVKEGVPYTNSIRDKAGKRHWIQWVDTRINEDIVAGIGQDVTGQVEIQERYQHLVENASDIICRMNYKGIFVYVNDDRRHF